MLENTLQVMKFKKNSKMRVNVNKPISKMKNKVRTFNKWNWSETDLRRRRQASPEVVYVLA